MKTSNENQDYFNGLIQGVVAMYKLGEDISNDLNIEWKIELLGSKKANVHCEYSISDYYVLTNPGDEDFAPDYKHINHREKITKKINNIEDAENLVMQIIDILDVLSLIEKY